MNIIYRKTLLSVSFLLFICISPLVVLYALGYRPNHLVANPSPVGVLIVESVPTRASVTINGQAYRHTPQSIANLPPGIFDLTVASDGYAPWHKHISVNSGQVTETRDIRLFPSSQSVTTLQSGVTTFSLSPHRRLIAALTADRKLHVIDEDGLAAIEPLTFPVLPDNLLWSPDSSSMLVVTAGQASLVSLTDQRARAIRLPQLDQALQLAWDQRIPGRLYAVTSGHDLIAYSVSNQSSQLIVANISSLATSSRQLYLVGDDNQIQIRTLQGGLIDSPFIETDKIIEQLHVTPGGNIAIQFTDRSAAVLTKASQLLPLADGIKKLGWSPDEQMLLVQRDDTSLHIMNVYDDRTSYIPLQDLHLVTRLSRPIRNPQWYAGGRHLIYQVDDEIMITEIDTRDQPATYSVDTTNLGDANITVGAQGAVILYLKKTAQSNRLVQANLIVAPKK